MQTWFLALRPWSFTAAIIPVLVGMACAWQSATVRPELAVLVVLAAVCMQAATNLLNTYGDFVSGVDTLNSAHTCPQLVAGQLEPQAMRKAGLAGLALAGCMGLVLAAWCGWPVLVFGLVGVLGAYGYTTGRMPYKYLGLGPFMVFWLMGPLMSAPAYYIQSGQLDATAFLVALPVAFLVAAILHANELRDIVHDHAANIRTFSTCMGLRAGIRLYMVLCAGAYASLPLLVWLEIVPLFALLPVLLAPAHLRMMRALTAAGAARLHPASPADPANPADDAIVTLEALSAQRHFQFGLLYVVGILAAGFLR